MNDSAGGSVQTWHLPASVIGGSAQRADQIKRIGIKKMIII